MASLPYRRTSQTSTQLLLLGLILLALSNYSYLVLRFVGQWNEGDTARITRSLYYAQQAHSVVDAPWAYTNGMGYTAVSLFVLEVTGLSPQTLQSIVFPLIMAVVPIVVFVFYRALIGRTREALLATLFVYIQPEFLWVTWRGSHERLIWILTFITFFLLAKSFLDRRFAKVTRFVLLFYLVVFALISTNAFFASSFINAVLLNFGGGLILLTLWRFHDTSAVLGVSNQIRRLLYVAGACIVLLYIFIFQIYPPAGGALNALRTLIESISALLLNFDVVSSNPYDYVRTAWTSTGVFIVLTLFNWIVLLSSLLVWIGGLSVFTRHGNALKERNLPPLLLWLMYPSFALQLAVSAITDFAGVLGGNFQVRLFTPMLLIAIPLAAMGLVGLLKALRIKWMRRAVVGVIAMGMLWFSMAALLKAANDPLLSNRWTFSTVPEKAAGDWAITHINGATVWTGIDERLVEAPIFYHPDLAVRDVRFDGFIPEPTTRYYLISSLEALRAARQGVSLPYVDNEELVYDNGEVSVYHQRPRTPYQR